MTVDRDSKKMSSRPILGFTGNPFVDAGVAVLCALSGKKTPADVIISDLRKCSKIIIRIYPRWQKLRNFFTINFMLLQPAIRDRHVRFDKYREYLQSLLKDCTHRELYGTCAICGSRDATILVQRHEHPLTGSGDLVNYFTYFEPGLAVCCVCAFVLQFVPLYIISNDGRLFLAHSHNEELMLELTRESVKSARGKAPLSEELEFFTPIQFAKNDINECIVKLAMHVIAKAENPYGETVIRLYSFVNSGQINKLEFVDLPGGIFNFLEKAKVGGLQKELDTLFHESSRRIYSELIRGESLIRHFVHKKERKLVGGWNLFELYLIEVEKLNKERLNVIKKVGDNLYKFWANKEDLRRRLDDLEGVENYNEFLILLNRAQKQTLIWEIDEQHLLFPEDAEGRVMWRETWAILLGYMYEKIHKEKKEGE